MSSVSEGVGVEFGWLVEYGDGHTCNGGDAASSGAHEPTCGMTPLLDLTGLSTREVVAWLINPFYAEETGDKTLGVADDILSFLKVENRAL